MVLALPSAPAELANGLSAAAKGDLLQDSGHSWRKPGYGIHGEILLKPTTQTQGFRTQAAEVSS